MRPLGISCTEDKIVQEMVRSRKRSMSQSLLDGSYGFGPSRRARDAPHQVNQEPMSKLVNWIADLDLAQFFDTMQHEEILAVLSTRIKEWRFLRLPLDTRATNIVDRRSEKIVEWHHRKIHGCQPPRLHSE